MGIERRRTPRYPFAAACELRDDSSGVTMATRVSDLSLYGCYITMEEVLPKDTAIHVKITSGEKIFEAPATVVHPTPGQGVGVTFHDVGVHSQIVLKEWLLQAAQAMYGPKNPMA